MVASNLLLFVQLTVCVGAVILLHFVPVTNSNHRNLSAVTVPSGGLLFYFKCLIAGKRRANELATVTTMSARERIQQTTGFLVVRPFPSLFFRPSKETVL